MKKVIKKRYRCNYFIKVIDWLLEIKQVGLEQSMKGSNFAFDYVNALFYKFY